MKDVPVCISNWKTSTRRCSRTGYATIGVGATDYSLESSVTVVDGILLGGSRSPGAPAVVFWKDQLVNFLFEAQVT